MLKIRNLYYMLCYAFDMPSYFKDNINVQNEDYNIYDLLGKLLIIEIDKLLKNGTYREYVEVDEVTRNVKGNININNSISSLSIINKKLHCNYDLYTDNILVNQIIKTTLTALTYKKIDNKIKKAIRLRLLYFSQIELINFNDEIFKQISFNSLNYNYKFILNICRIINHSLLVSDTIDDTFYSIVEEKIMNRIFEKFILNFYKQNLNKKEYKINANKINYNYDDEIEIADFKLEEELGTRQTDVVIRTNNLEITIDAKYYRNMKIKNRFNELTYRQSHLNQIRCYMYDSNFKGRKIGVLIYSSFVEDDKYDDGVFAPLLDNPIIIKTLNLNAEIADLRENMLSLIDKITKNQVNI